MADVTIPGGYVVENATVKPVDDNREVLNFRVAVTDRWPDGNGGQKEHTEWSDCAIWGKKGTLQNTADKLLVKGQLIYATGKKRTKIRRDEAGKYIGESTTIMIDRNTLKPLGSRPAGAGGGSAPSQPAPQQSAPAQPAQPAPQDAPTPVDDFDDDIPFG